METLTSKSSKRPPRDWIFNELVGDYKSKTQQVMDEIKTSFLQADDILRICAISGDLDSITELPNWCMKKRYRLLSVQHPFYLIEKTD